MEEKIDYLKNMPFRKEILEWCREYPNFLDALKIINSNRFAIFNGTTLTSPPIHPKDQVIGIVMMDLVSGILKQDFIVDNDSEHKHFTLYTRLPIGRDFLYQITVVEDIDCFYRKYSGGGKYYQKTHHPTLESLHPELQERINRYIELTHRDLKPPAH